MERSTRKVLKGEFERMLAESKRYQRLVRETANGEELWPFYRNMYCYYAGEVLTYAKLLGRKDYHDYPDFLPPPVGVFDKQ